MYRVPVEHVSVCYDKKPELPPWACIVLGGARGRGAPTKGGALAISMVNNAMTYLQMIKLGFGDGALELVAHIAKERGMPHPGDFPDPPRSAWAHRPTHLVHAAVHRLGALHYADVLAENARGDKHIMERRSSVVYEERPGKHVCVTVVDLWFVV